MLRLGSRILSGSELFALRQATRIPVTCVANLSTPFRSSFSTQGDNGDKSDQGISSSRTSTTAKLWQMREEAAREGKSGTLPPFIVRKKPSDSRLTIDMPLATDTEMRLQYESFDGGVRFGKVLEDLDAFSANVSHKHADDNNPSTRPLRLVTAAFDRIDMLKECPSDVDIQFTGYVSWVGRTSLESTIHLQDSESPIAVASCLMVAQDETTGKGAPVNQLEPETEEEIRAFEAGEANKAKRKHERQTSVHNVVPDPQEQELIHDLLMRPSAADRHDTITLCESGVQSTFLCEPQDMNRSKKIFGGYLMRKAYELALANVHIFAGADSKPLCISVDDIAFLRPVEVGSTVTFDSKIVYVPRVDGAQTCQVRVDTKVHITGSGPVGSSDTFTSNTFHFTFACPGVGDQGLRWVEPQSYVDAMLYLDGRRRFEHSRDVAIEHGSELAKYYPAKGSEEATGAGEGETKA